MYKTLLNKGFKPVYYTNDDWMTSREVESRLFYRYEVKSKDVLNSIFNIFDMYNKYFSLLENEDLVIYIEADEDLSEFWIYFYNVSLEIENFKIPKEKLNDLFNIIPNNFLLEYCY